MILMRDLFAATFFLFFGLQIDATGIPPVLLLAIGIGLITALAATKRDTPDYP
jgi:CPA2 family monovalent cation:H+ antiporter-2